MARRRPQTRANDTDRDTACGLLDSGLADGQLSMEEHRQRVAWATSASTLGELDLLVADLQTASAPVRLAPGDSVRPTRTRIRLLVGVTLAAVLIALGAGLGALLGETIGDAAPGATSNATAASEASANVSAPPLLLHSVKGLNGLLEETRRRFGDTKGYRMSIGPNTATLSRADPADAHREVVYHYQGGWTGSDPVPLEDAAERVVDLGAFDVAAVVDALQRAPEQLGIERRVVEAVYLDIAPSPHPAAPHAVEMTVRVDTFASKFHDGSMTLDPNGKILWEYPPTR